MKSFTVLFVLGMVLSLRAELVSLRFSVTDYDGHPIQGAKIALETAKKRTLPYARTEYKEFSCTTDKQGLAAERFFCWDGKVLCTVTAEGFYPETIRDVGFKTNYDMALKKTIFYEDSKKYEVRLRRIINPTTMTRNRILRGLKKLPTKKGVVGFDLEKGDFVKPDGKGLVPDFSIEYEWSSGIQSFEAKGRLVFSGDGSGAYVATKLPCDRFPVEYMVNTNKIFVKELRYSVKEDLAGGSVAYCDPLGQDEYMVIRSRVVLDENGKVVRANYSQIQGPFNIGSSIEFKDSYFNPTVNDTNLEYEQNLRYSNARR